MCRPTFVFLAAVTACLPSVDAKGFLGQKTITAQELDNALLRESVVSDIHRAVEEEMRPMFLSLPKNQYGRLDPSSVRYALHRYFVHKHGWHVKGFDPEGESWALDASNLTKEWAPAYIQQSFEKRSLGQGFGLEELASFAVAVADLIFGDGVDELEGIYGVLELPLDRPVSPEDLGLALRGYMAMLTTGISAIETKEDVRKFQEKAMSIDTGYQDILFWISDTFESRRWHESSRRNPFRGDTVTFEEATACMKDILHHFSSTLGTQCYATKMILHDHEQADNGRVTLQKFFSDAELPFKESVDYMRNQGFLEEGSGAPRIIIPNYLTSPGRCLPFTDYFSVCCTNECEGLVGVIEKSLRSPTVSPKVLADIVSKLPSDTVAAPRNLSEALLTRLGEIAQLHQGEVPIHGRLFAQWMHHAFPRECPWPHVAGTVKAASQIEWLDLHEDIISIRSPEEEMQRHINSTHDTEAEALPWTSIEELVAKHAQPNRKSRGWRWMHVVMGLMLLVSLVTPLARASRDLWSLRSDKSEFKAKSALLV